MDVSHEVEVSDTRVLNAPTVNRTSTPNKHATEKEEGRPMPLGIHLVHVFSF